MQTSFLISSVSKQI